MRIINYTIYFLSLVIISICSSLQCYADNNDYAIIKNSNELYNGCQVILVSKDYNKAMTNIPNSTNTRLGGIDVTFNENKDIVTAPEKAVVWTLQLGEDGYWYFYSVEYGYLNNSTTNTKDDNGSINIISTKATSCRNKISIDQNGITSIIFDEIDTRYLNYTGYQFGCKKNYDNTQHVYLYKPVASKTNSYISFEGNDTNIYNIIEGEEDKFISPKALVYSSKDNSLIENAEISYNSSNHSIATINNNGVVSINNQQTFGSTTITASYSGNDEYTACQKSYTINYKVQNKIATTLAFEENVDKQSITIKYGCENDFKGAVANITPDIDCNIEYKSSNEKVVKVNNEGILTYIGFGTATITASFVGNEKYESSSTYYKLEYKRDQIIFSSEKNSFKDLQRNSYYSGTQTFYDQYDRPYTFNINKGQLSRIDKGIFQLSENATSPIINAPNGYTITVDYYQSYSSSVSSETLRIKYNKDTNAEELTFKKVTTPNQSNGVGYRVTANIPTTSSFVIIPGNLAFISLIQIDINPIQDITLKETEDNNSILEQNNGKIVNVQLERTLLADKWNTFCVPFNTTLEDGKLCGIETTVREYDHMDGNIMKFKNTNNIKAGIPYLVKPNASNIENPSFDYIVINNAPLEKSGEDYFYMIGTYSPVEFSEEDSKMSLFINSQAQFMRPAANTKIKGMRAYFHASPSTQVNSLKVEFIDEILGISDIINNTPINSKRIYSLDGLYLGDDLNRLPKGIYIINGKKILK